MAKKAVAHIEIGDQEASLYPYNHVHITQKLFGHHQFEVEVPIRVLETSGPYVLSETKKLIGRPITINVQSEQLSEDHSLLFKGIVNDISLNRMYGAESTITIRGTSPTKLMDDRPMVRSFFSESDNLQLKDIADTVFQDHASEVLEGEIKPLLSTKLPYQVQYNETNYAFLQRLAHSWGEWFFYDGMKVIFGMTPEEAAFDLHLGKNLFNFDMKMRLVPVNFQVQAYNYAESKVLTSNGSDASINHFDETYGKIAYEESAELYSQAQMTTALQHIGLQQELDDMTKRMVDQQVSDMVYVNGVSDHVGLALGKVIGISGNKTDNPADGIEDYGHFIVTEINHRIDGNGNYQNHFEGIPKETMTPPPNPKVAYPHAAGQVAVIKENHDPDKLGRVRVQFKWQSGSDMTPWIRLSSSAAGGSGGFFVIPEKGDEVMIDFEYGNPALPFVLGSVYHKDAKPGDHYHNSDNNYKAIKTKSGNEIILLDEGGKEEIKILNKGGENSIILTMSDGGAINISSKNKISISCQEMSINAEKKLDITSEEINVNGSKFLKFTGETFDIQPSKTAYFSTKDFTVEASNSVTMNGTTSIDLETPGGKLTGNANQLEMTGATSAKLKGAQVNVEADAALTAKGNASTNIESAGITAVKGSIVQLN